jgi:UDP-N-acetylmuramoylalanine--D-glutamate ligase
MQFKDKKWVVIGCGITGIAAIKFLIKNGALVHVYDKKDDSFIKEKIKDFDEKIVTYTASSDCPDSLKGIEGVIVSPGIYHNAPIFEIAKRDNVPTWNDITLFLDLWQHRSAVIGVTGSNGKSTVVTLLYEAIKSSGKEVFLGGNIGNSPLDLLSIDSDKTPIVVLEISNYMLEQFDNEDYVEYAIITNLSENHLDRYDGSFDTYAEIKSKLVHEKYTKVVLDFDDVGVSKYILPKIKKTNTLVGVSLNSEKNFLPPSNVSLEDNKIIYSDENKNCILSNIDKRIMKGEHNLYNIALVFGILGLLNIADNQKVQETVLNFKGLEHRIEFVRELNGVKYINDSKSTSPDATIKALEAFGDIQNVVLVLGGESKGVSYHSLELPISQYVKSVIILPGDAKEKIEKILKKTLTPYCYASTLEEVVQLAHKEAVSGDIVLLSPASSSLNMFKGFEERGAIFKDIVNKQ